MCVAHVHPSAPAPLPGTVSGAAANVPAAVEKPTSKRHRPPPDVHRPRVCFLCSTSSDTHLPNRANWHLLCFHSHAYGV